MTEIPAEATRVPSPAPSASPGPAAEPSQRVGKGWIGFIALANLGLYPGYLGPVVLLPSAAGQPVRRVHDALSVRGRDDRAWLRVRVEDPLSPLTWAAHRTVRVMTASRPVVPRPTSMV
ncbi:MAG TPA: hypothetical protein VN840_15655 [Streptosporangiaceae bacterium]|nr:hypothetical protein [Streptosporangiaceae bacterium]